MSFNVLWEVKNGAQDGRQFVIRCWSELLIMLVGTKKNYIYFFLQMIKLFESPFRRKSDT